MKIGSLTQELSLLQGIKPVAPKMGGEISPNPSGATGQASFGDFLSQQLQDLNQLGLRVDQQVEDQIAGKVVNPHETQILLQQADISFKLMMSVKDQIEQAYQTIIRTSIG